MQSTIIFTFIANDKPGIIDAISKLVAKHQGNWLESRMTKLAGKFTGVVEISMDSNNTDDFVSDLQDLEQQGIKTLLETESGNASQSQTSIFYISVIGLDRPGIVRDLSHALASQAINIIDMHSVIENAAMSGETLFKAELEIDAPGNVDKDLLEDILETVCTQLDIDWNLSGDTPATQ